MAAFWKYLRGARRAPVALMALALFVGANLVLALWPAVNPVHHLRDADRFVWYTRLGWLRAGQVGPRALADYQTFVLGDSQVMSGVRADLLERTLNLGVPSQQPEGLIAFARLLPAVDVSSADASTGERRRVLLNVNPFSLFQSEVVLSFAHYYRSEAQRYAMLANVATPGSLRQAAALGAGSPARLRGPGDLLHQLLLFVPAYQANGILTPLLSVGESGLSGLPFQNLRADASLLPASQYARYLAEPPSVPELLRNRGERNRRLAERLESSQGFWIWKDFAETERSRPGAGGDRPTCAGRSELAYDSARGPGLLFYPERRGAVAAYRRVLRILDERGYRVELIRIPFSPAYANLVNRDLVYTRVAAETARIVKDFKHVRVHALPGADAGLDQSAAMFSDLTHLSVCGATRFTEWLVEKGLATRAAVSEEERSEEPGP